MLTDIFFYINEYEESEKIRDKNLDFSHSSRLELILFLEESIFKYWKNISSKIHYVLTADIIYFSALLVFP